MPFDDNNHNHLCLEVNVHDSNLARPSGSQQPGVTYKLDIFRLIFNGRRGRILAAHQIHFYGYLTDWKLDRVRTFCILHIQSIRRLNKRRYASDLLFVHQQQHLTCDPEQQNELHLFSVELAVGDGLSVCI